MTKLLRRSARFCFCRTAARWPRRTLPSLRRRVFRVASQGTVDAATAVDGTPQTLLEGFGQTLYVEKGAEPTALLLPEVVAETQSVSLVPASRPPSPRILAEILAIALPAVGTVLADPLMSLIDTACVGQISAIQLAALGPNTAIFNMFFAVFGVVGSAVANCIARRSVHAPGLTPAEIQIRQDQNETVLSHTLTLAVGLGVMLMGLLFSCGPLLLRLMGLSPVAMSAALEYLYVRALAMPAVLFINVSQGACLGQQDMWTPMKVVLAAGLINLVGDVGLIMLMGLGTMGAAAATAGAQIAGALYFFHYLRKGSSTGRALRLKWKGLPSRRSLQPILDMASVLAPRSCVLMLAYTVMTAVATSMGTQVLAAHQVALQLFWFLSFFPEPLSLTGQSLLARDRDDRRRTASIAEVLMKFAASAGVVLAGMYGAILTVLPHVFTSDPSVVAAFQQVIPHGMLTLFLCSVALMIDGVFIGLHQIQHLPGNIYASTAATLGSLWLSHRMRLGLNGVWIAAAIFFGTRILLHVTYLARNWNLSPFKAPSLEPQLAWEGI